MNKSKPAKFSREGAIRNYANDLANAKEEGVAGEHAKAVAEKKQVLKKCCRSE